MWAHRGEYPGNRRGTIIYGMIVGLDLDNTIICYDDLIHAQALALDVISADLPADKASISQFLKESGRNDVWTYIQGRVYGPELLGAEPFPGAREFVDLCFDAGIPVHIVSHKTRYAAADPTIDLREWASRWLDKFGFSTAVSSVTFSDTREAKVDRIASLECSHFLDDLDAVFREPKFPEETLAYLFDPKERFRDWTGSGERVNSWKQFQGIVFPDGV